MSYDPKRCGEQMVSLWDIADAAKKKRALTCRFGAFHRRPLPASVVINWPAFLVMKAMDSGLFIYEKDRT